MNAVKTFKTFCVKCGKPASINNVGFRGESPIAIHIDVQPQDWPIGHAAKVPNTVQNAAESAFIAVDRTSYVHAN